jgi:hypothetical protein
LRTFWAQTTLATVPPSHWSERFQRESSALIEATLEDPFADAILAGWTEAAARFASQDLSSAEWLLPLWQHWAGAVSRMEGAARSQALQRLRILLAKMPKDAAETGLVKLFESSGPTAIVEGLDFLHMLPRPWSEGFSLPFLSIVRGVLRSQTDNAAYQWANSLFVAARAIPATVFSAALAPWEVVAPQGTAGWHVEAVKREIDKFTETIETRQTFMAELRA